MIDETPVSYSSTPNGTANANANGSGVNTTTANNNTVANLNEEAVLGADNNEDQIKEEIAPTPTQGPANTVSQNGPNPNNTNTNNKSQDASNDFYVRYYVGHRGKFGHEFLEFEIQANGRLRYANNSQYKSGNMIKKEAYVSQLVVQTLKFIVEDSKILDGSTDDSQWPEPSESGKQELEICCGEEHISFTTSKLGKLKDVQDSKDPEGLRKFYYLIQDLKCYVFSLMNLHFRINPVQKI